MKLSKSQKSNTVLYAIILSLIDFIPNLARALSGLDLANLSFLKFFLIMLLFILVVLRHKDNKRPYLIPIKILLLAMLFVLLFNLILAVSYSNEIYEDNFVGLTTKIAYNLPRSITKLIIFTISCFLPFITATIIAIVNKNNTSYQ